MNGQTSGPAMSMQPGLDPIRRTTQKCRTSCRGAAPLLLGRSAARDPGPGAREEGRALCLIRRSNAGVVVRDDHTQGTGHGRQARDAAGLRARSLAPLSSGSASRNSWTATCGEIQRSPDGLKPAIPYSNHGVERETRLELATLTLARCPTDSGDF